MRRWSSAHLMSIFPLQSSLGQSVILEPSSRRFGESPILHSARRMEQHLLLLLIGSVGDPGTLAKGLWRVAEEFFRSPNGAHSSLAPPRFVRPPMLQAIIQAWCCPTGSYFMVHMFPCKA
ncbi:hypothetical protein KY284_032540 [Solanum tuberosum]|nr:hypothetical protein KY284_032540 [Solanum tuberosum]